MKSFAIFFTRGVNSQIEFFANPTIKIHLFRGEKQRDNGGKKIRSGKSERQKGWERLKGWKNQNQNERERDLFLFEIGAWRLCGRHNGPRRIR